MNWRSASADEMRELGMEPGPGGGWRFVNDGMEEAAPLRDAVVGSVGDGVHLTSLADVEMRRVRFAWDARIPFGALTIIAGIPGQGKSHLTTWLGARLTQGQLPGDLYREPANVVVASAEDALASVLTPRFVAAGGELKRVYSVAVTEGDASLGIAIPDDLEGIRRELAASEARLLVVDPLLAHIPTRIDGYKDQHVRTALAPLARMAEELDVAIVGVMHLNKRESADLFSRVGGSGGFLAAARSALLVAEDPDEPDLRIIAHGKSNLSRLAGSLRFRLQGQELDNPDRADPNKISVANVVMLGESERGIEALLGGRRSSTRTEATAWLAQLLASGPKPAETVEAEAKDAGFGWRTVERAKDELGVRSEHIGGLGSEGYWEWVLP